MSKADICLIIEGGYPYVASGVGYWVDGLIHSLPDFTFHLCLLVPPGQSEDMAFELPENVTGLTRNELQELPQGIKSTRKLSGLLKRVGHCLHGLQNEGGLKEIKELLTLIKTNRGDMGTEPLLNSRQAWSLMMTMYNESQHSASFIDYFWSWRALAAGLYSTLLAPLPEARVYHAVSTGYAGLMLARASLETGRPTILTEHGIYTNERRIEIAMSDWLHEVRSNRFSIENIGEQLREMWVQSFVSYSRACYQAGSEIITLFEENQALQLKDGADPERVRIIPNGIDTKKYAVESVLDGRPPTIALIGRVAPVKDILSFIRCAAILKDRMPQIKILVMGRTDEDPRYFQECQRLAETLKLGQTLVFTGKVDVPEYLKQIDVVVLTSISEGQPLVLLEAGAAGIPLVATDVGACREIVLGGRREDPGLGPAGAITALADPSATANAVHKLLTDSGWYGRCSRAIKERVHTYFDRSNLVEGYRGLFAHYIEAEPDTEGGYSRWPG